MDLGITHLTPTVPREDVAAVLAALIERDDAHGLAPDLVGGSTPIAEAVEQAVTQKQSRLNH